MDIWQGALDQTPDGPWDLLLAFGPREAMEQGAGLQARFPDAVVAGCSGAGQIHDTTVDDKLVVTALRFDKTNVRSATSSLLDDGTATGEALAAALPKDDLRHVIVLSDGLNINGTALAASMQEHLPSGVAVTGGLAGDGDRFETTLVLSGDKVAEKQVVAIGFYGDALRIGYGSLGGWDPFGPVRTVTKSNDNVLQELDGQSALDLYKLYLGDHAQDLPASGLLFPLHLADERGGLVRTILAVDDKAGSLTFAGDVPTGSKAQFMKANFDRLVDGASGAASTAGEGVGQGAEFALLVSCVGRRLVLKQRSEDELDAVKEVLGDQASMAGFYSYGEICPAAPGADCQLHNQTMTITTFREV